MEAFVLPPQASRVVLSVNPKAGRRSSADRVERLAQLLQKKGFSVLKTTDLGEAASAANAFHQSGELRALVGVGGDGTAAELVNRTAPGVPVTLLAAGTENLLARYLNLGRSPEDLASMLAAGRVVQFDAGRANGRLFLLMMGCGFDAEAVDRLHRRRSGHNNYSKWVVPIASTIWGYRYPEMDVAWSRRDPSGDNPIEGTIASRWLFAFNLPCYGGGMPIAPQAVGTDGLLDVCSFARGSTFHGLKYALAIKLGMHQGLSDCTVQRVQRMTITAAEPVRYQLDGDPGGELPVEVDIVERRLTTLVPPESQRD